MQKGSRAGREEPLPAFQRPASVFALPADLRSEAKAMSRGIIVRITRAEAIRIVGAAMREKTQQWEREKKAYPPQFAAAKKRAVGKIKGYLRQIERSNDPKKIRKLIDACDLDWKEREKLSGPPMLNICELKGFLFMLQ